MTGRGSTDRPDGDVMPEATVISLLADKPECIPAVADMRWREWGHPPEPEDPAWWLETTSREAGRSELPVTFVAVDTPGDAIGAVGIDEYDLDERRDTSPWITGMIVRGDRRGLGVGSALMRHAESWALQHGVDEMWVGTGTAERFYQRCGWRPLEVFTTGADERVSVLYHRLG
jgi:GNAT superfamily N-acetyltransferase